jgi:YVTN family beta-propeller protein
VARFDPQVSAAIPIPHLAGRVRVSGTATGSIAVGAGAVWAAFGSSAVARIDPRTRRGAVVGDAGVSPSAIAYGEDALWIANRDDDTVSRFSTSTYSTLHAVSVGRAPAGVAVGGGFVWVTDSADDAVSRVDPRLNSSTTIPVGRVPLGIAYGEGGVWIANSGDGTVSRIDPSTSKVVKTIKVGGRPVGIAVGDGLVWVTVEAP